MFQGPGRAARAGGPAAPAGARDLKPGLLAAMLGAALAGGAPIGRVVHRFERDGMKYLIRSTMEATGLGALFASGKFVQESQGLIADRTREILGTSDQGVVMFRRMLTDAIDAVACGEDPPGIVRSEGQGFIDFDAQQTRDGVLLSA